MDSAEQADGENRVKRLLVEPLMRRGLARPSTLTKAKFEDMVKDLCARLAYMSELNLQALEDQCAGNPGGKIKDRFPIANDILKWAADIHPPGEEASPLTRAVFAAQLGLDALTGGWAPELLGYLKKSRRWPSSFLVMDIRKRADDAIRQMQKIEDRLARDEQLPPAEATWRARRLATIRKCQAVADLGLSSGGGV